MDNGLLLRSDVHTLFDLGYLGINEHYELQVSRRLREEWGTGASSTSGLGSGSRCRALE